ncbi:MAG: threonine/serine exporter family protein, partial [Lachnospiraceae bacterium]|nr:threonine/serine exporter family protein [Lachnospiraceae bacterium]
TASDAQSYSPGTTLFFSLLSAAALTGIYDGSLSDLLIILLNMVLINLLGAHMKKWVNNKIIYNVLSAFIIGAVALFFDRIDFLDGYSTVMIVNSLKLVPGVPMVNSLRNLLTGNERNGILELLKLLLETAGIACGFLLSIVLGLGGLA